MPKTEPKRTKRNLHNEDPRAAIRRIWRLLDGASESFKKTGAAFDAAAVSAVDLARRIAEDNREFR